MNHDTHKARQKQPHRNRVFPILGMLAMILLGAGYFLSNVNASSQPESARSVAWQAATPTPSVTSEVTPEVSAEVIKEGRPTGIIVGALVIFLIILISTLPTVIRRPPPQSPNP